MVQTRSAAKRQQAEEDQRISAVPKPLVRETTVVEITPSDTGLGTHIRWLRPLPNQLPEILSLDMTLDHRFVTPAPETQASLRTPPKLSRHRRIGNPGIFNTGRTVRFNLYRHEVEDIVESAKAHGRDLLTEFELYSQEETSSDPLSDTPTDTFENIFQNRTLVPRSPFPGTQVESPTPLRMGPNGTHLDVSSNEPTLILGPHGTHLNFHQAPGNSLTERVWGLGPNDTVLLGPDGRAIVPGIRPGY